MNPGLAFLIAAVGSIAVYTVLRGAYAWTRRNDPGHKVAYAFPRHKERGSKRRPPRPNRTQTGEQAGRI